MNKLTSPPVALETAPLKPAKIVSEFGKTLIVAPHPDDETLGCGGLLALLSQAGLSVEVLVISDGTLSHPNSISYPAPRLRELRESETRAGIRKLGVPDKHLTFWRYLDRSVPTPGSAEFALAVERCQQYLARIRPSTICVPWRRDPHPDHRATAQIFRTAISVQQIKPRLLEYLIWTWELAQDSDYPHQDEVVAWKLDISQMLGSKKAAINCYLSQISNLIDDDPNGFRLSAEVLSHFKQPWELFLEDKANE